VALDIGVDELRDLYNQAESGDSIFKAPGSLKFQLKKKDTVLFFYPECDGNEMK
jgi:hypothetical protein